MPARVGFGFPLLARVAMPPSTQPPSAEAATATPWITVHEPGPEGIASHAVRDALKPAGVRKR